MGAYINPPDMSKERWLEENAIELSGVPRQYRWTAEDESKSYSVCLVDNVGFSAAGIAFDRRELDDFAHPDGRPKRWFVAKEKDLVKVSDLEKWLAQVDKFDTNSDNIDIV